MCLGGWSGQVAGWLDDCVLEYTWLIVYCVLCSVILIGKYDIVHVYRNCIPCASYTAVILLIICDLES